MLHLENKSVLLFSERNQSGWAQANHKNYDCKYIHEIIMNLKNISTYKDGGVKIWREYLQQTAIDRKKDKSWYDGECYILSTFCQTYLYLTRSLTPLLLIQRILSIGNCVTQLERANIEELIKLFSMVKACAYIVCEIERKMQFTIQSNTQLEQWLMNLHLLLWRKSLQANNPNQKTLKKKSCQIQKHTKV